LETFQISKLQHPQVLLTRNVLVTAQTNLSMNNSLVDASIYLNGFTIIQKSVLKSQLESVLILNGKDTGPLTGIDRTNDATLMKIRIPSSKPNRISWCLHSAANLKD